MFTAPLKWPVQLDSWLPALLRPGVLLALIVLVLWFVFIRRGLPDLWHAFCRWVARIIDLVVGLILLPDYLLTTSRGKAGKGPGAAVLVMGEFADRTLDAVGGLYERHRRDPTDRRSVPWVPCLAAVVILAIPWVVMKKAPATSSVRRDLAATFDHWRDLERWADVPPSRLAAAGITWPPRPHLRRLRRHGRVVGIALRCPRTERCVGRLILSTAGGELIRSRLVAAPPRSTATVHMRLSRSASRTHHFRIRIARADPA